MSKKNSHKYLKNKLSKLQREYDRLKKIKIKDLTPKQLERVRELPSLIGDLQGSIPNMPKS